MTRAAGMLLAVLAGCAGKCGEQGSSAATSQGVSSPPRIPSFRGDIAPVLVLHCSSADGCHGNKPSPSVDLDLRDSSAYGQLVGKPSEARRGAQRVKPGDPESSFLVDKLTGRLGSAQEGKRMPIDAETGAPIVPSPLPADFVENVLEPWIAAGAPNN